METLDYIEVESTLDKISVSNLSSRHLTENEYNDKILDNILEFQKLLSKLTNLIEEATEDYEKLTWYELTDELKAKVDKILLDSVNTRRMMIKLYIFLKNNATDFASQAIKEYKFALDDYKETLDDVYNTIFVLPNNEVFKQINKEISQL